MIQGCATSETNKHSLIQAVVLPCQTWQTDDIIQLVCPSAAFRELLARKGFMQRLSKCFSAEVLLCKMEKEEASIPKRQVQDKMGTAR